MCAGLGPSPRSYAFCFFFFFCPHQFYGHSQISKEATAAGLLAVVIGPQPSSMSPPVDLSSLPNPGSLGSISLFSPLLGASSLPSLSSTSSVAAAPVAVSTAPLMSAVLAQPAVAPVPRSGPLILSSALPPVPARAADKIWAGQFIEFKELLSDNVALLQRLQDMGVANQPHSLGHSWMREVHDPLTWVSCFLTFMATKIAHQETQELAAYGLIVVHLARKHGGRGWLSYDAMFRQQAAAGSPVQWTELNPSLMAATVINSSTSSGANQGRSCSLCLSPDHSRSECALLALEFYREQSRLWQQGQSPQVGHSWPPDVRSKPYPSVAGVCRRFNRGSCMAVQCRFAHVCSGCSK